jgi:hypothetical protein
MNYPIVIVGCLTVLALLAHLSGGIIQSLSVEPAKVSSHSKDSLLQRNWVQMMCAFQLVSIDLLVLSALLFTLAFTDVIAQKQLFGFALSGFYFLWGCVWLLQLAFLKQKTKEYFFLGHWVFWFVCSALIYWGSLSL